MAEQVIHTCAKCHRSQEIGAGKPAPQCCGQPMEAAEPLPVCQAPATAEHSRPDDDAGPCDDGRAG